MKPESRNKEFGIKRFFNSIKNSLEGIKYAYMNEQRLFLHALFTIFSIILGFIFQIKPWEWISILGLLCVVLVVELLNTSIEAVCDTVTRESHSWIKIAKDTASASAFIAACVTVLLECAIFIPYMIELW